MGEATGGNKSLIAKVCHNDAPLIPVPESRLVLNPYRNYHIFGIIMIKNNQLFFKKRLDSYLVYFVALGVIKRRKNGF